MSSLKHGKIAEYVLFRVAQSAITDDAVWAGVAVVCVSGGLQERRVGSRPVGAVDTRIWRK
jgi:hypothetical protein